MASLSSELETLQKLLRDAGRDEQEPIYFSLDDGAEPEAALDQLIKAGKITGRERDRVGFIVRTIIDPKPWSTDLESATKKIIIFIFNSFHKSKLCCGNYEVTNSSFL